MSDPSETPGQTGGPPPPSLGPPSPLHAVVSTHTTQLATLNAELTRAFSQVTGEIGSLRGSSRGTTEALVSLAGQVAALARSVNQLLASPTPPVADRPEPNPVAAPPAQATPPDPRCEPNLPCPRPFGGEFELCRGFLGQCELLFRHQPSRYGSGEARIALIMSLLTDRALRWAIAAAGRDSRLSVDYQAFITEFGLVFDHPADGSDAASRLHSIAQGTRSVADYTLEFRILAADSGWDDAALRSAYRRGLSEAIKDLIIRDRPTSFAALVSLALLMDERLRERRVERAQRSWGAPKPPTGGSPSCSGGRRETAAPPLVMSPGHSTSREEEEPMQLGRSRLSQEEREQRMRDRLCLYCGRPGHHIRACPTRPKDQAH